MLKVIRYSVAVLLAAIFGLWAHVWFTLAPGQSFADAFGQRLAQVFGQDMQLPSAAGVVQLPPGISLGGAFSLTRQDGVAVTERDYASQWMLIYFGFTFCPDVCPTELGRMADVMDMLGPLAGRVTPVLITIDPERDRPDNLADYVSRFHPRLQALTGTTEQIAAVARQFRVFYARANSPNATDYLMDHSSFIYLVGPDNRVRSLFRPDTAVDGMARMIIGQLRATTPTQ